MKAAAAEMLAEGVDRKRLHLARQRFRAVNTARLERLYSVLADPHRAVVDLLPLLLNDNHPALPGYVSPQTPSGVQGYSPDRKALDRARALSISYQPVHRARSEADIQGIFLIGSTGTIGQSSSSDLDVWVCYPDHLAADRLVLLARKTQLLMEWAKRLNLEMQIFLMNPDKFRRGQREPLTGENCGTAQHYLLLDEFYRTGILIAGRIPGWWLVPPEADPIHDAYCRNLTDKRYFKQTELVDFGGIDGVPGAEFVGAGIWQLFKAIGSPHKSVLKLLLVEVYAAGHPHTRCLCSDYKQAVYDGVVDIDALDPYVMLYRRLETFLSERGQFERLELVRRCLYYKGNKKLSRPPARGVKSWQRVLMEKLVEEWGWNAAKLRQLDRRASWSILDVQSERRELVAELTSSYRFLSDFSRDQSISASIDAREMNILGRKLYAAFERKAGKVEVLNPRSEINVAESELSFCCLRGEGSNQLWSVHAELVAANEQPQKRALRQTASLSELICWCVVNGVAGERTRIAVREKLDGLSYGEAENLIRTIREFIQGATVAADDSDQAFVEPVKATAFLMLVNVASDPHESMRARGLHRISSRTDSLGYSATRENLVRNVETLSRNSWGEIICTRYEGAGGLLRCLRDYLHMGPVRPGASRPRATVRSFCASRALAIERRIQELLDDVDMDFDAREPERGGRYVLEMEGTLYLIIRRGQQVASVTAGDENGLMRLLAEPQRHWNPLTIDRYALQRSPLVLLSEYMKPGVCSVFCETRKQYCVITVIDERGAIFSAPYQPERETTALAATAQFLRAVRERQDTLSTLEDNASAPRRQPRFFSLYRDQGSSTYRIRALESIPRIQPGMYYLNVQAIAHRDDDNHTVFTIYVDDQAFHESELQERFSAEVANYIISTRAKHERYAVYINDLDLSCLAADIDPPLQTIHYLRYRFHLESLINRELLNIDSD